MRLLAYLNRADMGSYAEAVDNPARPANIIDTRTYRFKYGFGLNAEYELIHGLGVFTRLGWNATGTHLAFGTEEGFAGLVDLSKRG